MIFPDVDLNTWTNKYNLQVTELTCSSCKKKFATDVPVAIKGYRGLQTTEHECGKKFVSAIFTPVEKAKMDFWLKFKYGY